LREPKLKDLDIDQFLVRRGDGLYSKAFLWNQATSKAKSDKFIFLDDDHPFLTKTALRNFNRLLEKYPFVIGRIIHSDGTTRLFRSSKVQGTTFAMTRKLLTEVGGFGEYTMQWGRGEDSDIFWKAYLALRPNKESQKRAAYACHIVTYDTCSGRWNTAHGDKETFITEFKALHGVHPHNNPCRVKGYWVEYPTIASSVLDRSLYVLERIEAKSKMLRRTIRNARLARASLFGEPSKSVPGWKNFLYRFISSVL
jgi:hypothetical protein